MPIKIPAELPAIETLRKENIVVTDATNALNRGVRPVSIAIVNLMPVKTTTEADLIRLLSNSPLQIKLDFVRMETHKSKNTPEEHLTAFYQTFPTIRQNSYDGMIITGAPVELLPFEEVNYWEELKTIMDWSKSHVTSSLYICWAAQAGLYHHFGVPKHTLAHKLSGVFEHTSDEPSNPLCRGFDDVFHAPHSRYTEVRAEDILKHPELKLLSTSAQAGVYIVMGRNGREFYITGHSEYAPERLDIEYKRDLNKHIPIAMPQNYYKDNNPANPPIIRWRSHANLLFTNWLNHFVCRPIHSCRPS
ncbi:MAG: homoserine O-succinyltransferase [Prevotellaceae bacterium]|jgi:homoserine O-succinyltransferase|nr:homoserine O-succinyltransferase [Prevotellaceae bacterium]